VTPPISRRNLLKGAVAGSAALTLPGWLAACSTAPLSASAAGPGSSGTPKSGGTLVVGLYLEPTAIDPNREYFWETYRVSRNIYENLVQEDLSTNTGVPKLVPGLATGWTASDSYRTWTLSLRKGVKFHDGGDFSAHSLDLNVRRFNDPAYRYFDKTSQGLLASRFGDLAKTAVVDDFTYSFTFNHPYIGLPRLLAQSIATILPFSNTALAKYGNDGLAQHPTGTGPYKFVSRQIGNQIVLDRNPAYWGKQPYLDKIVFRIIANDATRLAALESGEVHIISRVQPQDVNSLTAKGFAVPAGVGAQVDYIQFNWKNKYIQNTNVRQALAQALNRNGDATDIYNGYAKALRTFLPISNVAYNPDADYGYTYDAAGAKASLAKSGYAPGEVSFNIVTWTEDTPEASYLAENFKAAGINAQAVGVSSADLFARQTSPQPDDGIFLGEYGGTYPEWISEGYDEAVTSIGGAPYVEDKVISAAIAKARYNSDPASYVQRWQEADAVLVNNAAVVPTVNFTRYYGVSPQVRGFVWPNTNWYSLWDVWLES